MICILGVSCCNEIATVVPIVVVICADAQNLAEKQMEKKLKMVLVKSY